MNVVESRLMERLETLEARATMRALIRGEEAPSNPVEDVNEIRQALGERDLEGQELVLRSVGSRETSMPAAASDENIRAALEARERMKQGGPIVL